MTNELGFKELYDVSLKATYSIEVGGSTIEPGETIASFDKIQIANFQEIKSVTSANGGFDNRGLVFWESTKEVKINFTQGVFSKTQLALMANAQLIENTGEEIVSINAREEFESDEMGKISMGHTPRGPMFVYDKATGEKITDWTCADDILYLSQQYKEVIVDYWYDYNNGFTTMRIGKPLTTGFLSLIGKMRVKDDTTGKVVTGIIKIPKLRLMSDLSMRVGSDAIPQVGRLDAVAVPEGVRGQTKVMEIIFLNDDIDADM
jgi:hypothetical protein